MLHIIAEGQREKRSTATRKYFSGLFKYLIGPQKLVLGHLMTCPLKDNTVGFTLIQQLLPLIVAVFHLIQLSGTLVN